jgi:hypothetical protein
MILNFVPLKFRKLDNIVMCVLNLCYAIVSSMRFPTLTIFGTFSANSSGLSVTPLIIKINKSPTSTES